MHRIARAARLGVAAATVTATTLLFVAAPASAHEQRTVDGKYHVEVGWGDEPTYAGFKNSVQLILNDANDKPVTDLGDTLKVEVKTGTQAMTLPFEPNFEVGGDGTPGDYRAWLVPTRPGGYTFHITGTIHNDNVDQTFTSSDTTFDDVKSATDVEFPVKDPSAGDLSTKLDRTQSRFTTQAKDAKDSADSAKTIALIGIVVGAVGIVIGATALTRKR